MNMSKLPLVAPAVASQAQTLEGVINGWIDGYISEWIGLGEAVQEKQQQTGQQRWPYLAKKCTKDRKTLKTMYTSYIGQITCLPDSQLPAVEAAFLAAEKNYERASTASDGKYLNIRDNCKTSIKDILNSWATALTERIPNGLVAAAIQAEQGEKDDFRAVTFNAGTARTLTKKGKEPPSEQSAIRGRGTIFEGSYCGTSPDHGLLDLTLGQHALVANSDVATTSGLNPYVPIEQNNPIGAFDPCAYLQCDVPQGQYLPGPVYTRFAAGSPDDGLTFTPPPQQMDWNAMNLNQQLWTTQSVALPGEPGSSGGVSGYGYSQEPLGNFSQEHLALANTSALATLPSYTGPALTQISRQHPNPTGFSNQAQGIRGGSEVSHTGNTGARSRSETDPSLGSGNIYEASEQGRRGW